MGDYLPARAAAVSAIEQHLLRVVEAWGFQRVIPPALEFEDVLAQGMGDGLRGRCFRFDDWQSGRLLAVPPDITPQIARIVATRLKGWPLPHRLCYSGRVLRHTELQAGRSREIMQAGVELIGLESPEADAEMVAMAVEVMHAVGLRDFKVALGQTAFCRGIFEASGLSGKPLLQLREAVARKDATHVVELLRQHPISEQSYREIVLLPRLFGGIEILEEAERVVINETSRKALYNISEVLGILNVHGVAEYLTVDLGEIRGLDYHTGLTFEAFVPGIGESLFSGGRYDDLMGRFGCPAPATGFTFNLLNLLQALEGQDGVGVSRRDILLFNSGEDRSNALEIARQLRLRGYSVARDIIKRDQNASLEYAAQNGLNWMLIVSGEQDNLLLIRTGDRQEQQVTQQELWSIFPARP